MSKDYLVSQSKDVVNWKAQGKKVIGYFCHSFPQEIIYAAGLLPVRILGTSAPLSEANNYWSPYCCYFTRSSVELALEGKLTDLDGTVMTYTCDVMSFLSHRWSQIEQLSPGHFTYFLVRPQLVSDTARDVYRRELIHFHEALKSIFRLP